MWRSALAVHTGVLTLVCIALLPVYRPAGSFTSDEGAYALQARALQKGSWEYDYKALDVDPDGRFFPLILFDRTSRGFYPSLKHPAYPLALATAGRVGGAVIGLHLLPLAGAVATAVAAWLLAAQLSPHLSRPAFWFAAASPVLVNGQLLWAHSLSAALSGFASLAAVRLVKRGLTPARALPVAAILCAGTFLRSEGLLFAIAVALVLAAIALKGAGVARAIAILATVALPSVAVTFVERVWIHAISGSGGRAPAVRGGSGGFLHERFTGAWHELFQTQAGSAAIQGLTFAVLVGGAVAGGLALRAWRPGSPGVLLGAVTAVLVVALTRFAGQPDEEITGCFAAFPLALLALVALPWRSSDPTVKLLAGVASVFILAVLATQYPEGGGVEWGGRFLSPLIAPFAVLIAVASARGLASAPADARPLVTGMLVALAAVPAVVGVTSVALSRVQQDRLISAVERHPASVTATTIRAFPRSAWRTHDRLSWMLAPPAQLADLLAQLRAAGVPDVALVVRDGTVIPEGSFKPLREVDEPALRETGLKLIELRPAG